MDEVRAVLQYHGGEEGFSLQRMNNSLHALYYRRWFIASAMHTHKVFLGD